VRVTALQTSVKFCASLLFFPISSGPLLSACRLRQAFLELNNPSSFGFQELHPNRKAFALQRMAVGHSSRGTKLSGARGKGQFFALLPAPHADNASATRTYIFGKSRFGTGHVPVSIENHGNFHRNALFRAVVRKRSERWAIDTHKHAAIRERF